MENINKIYRKNYIDETYILKITIAEKINPNKPNLIINFILTELNKLNELNIKIINNEKSIISNNKAFITIRFTSSEVYNKILPKIQSIILNVKQHFNIQLNYNFNTSNLKATIFTILSLNVKDKFDIEIEALKNSFIKYCSTITDYNQLDVTNNIRSIQYKFNNNKKNFKTGNSPFYKCKVIITINLNLYEKLIEAFCKENNYNELTYKFDIDHSDISLLCLEHKGRKYNFKEFLDLCYTCKKTHTLFFKEEENKKEECIFVCDKCSSKKQIHTCKPLNETQCNLCKYYYKVNDNHFPNKIPCLNYTNVHKEFILSNRNNFIKRVFKINKIKTNIEKEKLDINDNNFPVLPPIIRLEPIKKEEKDIKIKYDSIQQVEIIKEENEYTFSLYINDKKMIFKYIDI